MHGAFSEAARDVRRSSGAIGWPGRGSFVSMKTKLSSISGQYNLCCLTSHERCPGHLQAMYTWISQPHRVCQKRYEKKLLAALIVSGGSGRRGAADCCWLLAVSNTKPGACVMIRCFFFQNAVHGTPGEGSTADSTAAAAPSYSRHLQCKRLRRGVSAAAQVVLPSVPGPGRSDDIFGLLPHWRSYR